ncbi:MAG TPA: deoxyribonuclease IV [Actinomycetota bacterium]|nr:deoxyribonuclease IV [Actinomycetota bacterium]
MRIGAHLATGGRTSGAVDAARGADADAVQIFVSNPRAWAARAVTPEEAATTRARLAEADVALFVHAAYLVNVASPNPAFLSKSVASARADLAVAEAVGAGGLVLHGGAGGPTERPAALRRAARVIREIAAGARATEVLVELTAGGAGTVASTLPEAAELFDAIGEGGRVALCIDTCHLFAAGYGLDEPDGVGAAFAELDDLGLASRLRLVHANDAAFERGSRRDRHARVGTGFIGEAGFRAILAQPALAERSVVIETSGSPDDHRDDVARLRALAPESARRTG